MEHKKKELKAAKLTDVAASASAFEIVDRYGSATAEFIKGYTGIDNETGKHLARGGLKGIAKYSASDDKAISQQAGFSAEVRTVSKANARHIIEGRDVRLHRTDDHPDFKMNHPVLDHVETDAGGVVAGSGSQMKFVTNTKDLLKKIACGDGGGGDRDLSRYRGVTLDLPSDQVEKAKAFCAEQAQSLREQAEAVAKLGKEELAERYRREAANFEELRGNIRDSGMTMEEAIRTRTDPLSITARDIFGISHEAGLQGAKVGAVVGGTISMVTNVIAVCQDDKDLRAALLDTAAATGKAAAMGYGTAFVGSALKGAMQQSANVTTRTLSRTSLPSMAVSVCLELGGAIRRYARGEIDGVEFLETIGEKGSGMLASGLGTMVGQVAIPIPIVGGVIGGMVGYTLSSMLYQSSLDALKAAEQAHEQYLHTKAVCEQAQASMEAYRCQFAHLFEEYLAEGRAAFADCLAAMDDAVAMGDADGFARSANALGEFIGHSLRFATVRDFNDFMATDEPLVL